MMTPIVTKFLDWDIPELSTLQDSKVYQLRVQLNEGTPMNRQQKNWLADSVNSNTYFKILLSDKTILRGAETIWAGTYCRSQPFSVTLLLPQTKTTMGKSNHLSGQPLYSQVIKLLNKSKILPFSRENGGERYSSFNCWIHLVVMLYAVIMRFNLLREITLMTTSTSTACSAIPKYAGKSCSAKHPTPRRSPRSSAEGLGMRKIRLDSRAISGIAQYLCARRFLSDSNNLFLPQPDGMFRNRAVCLDLLRLVWSILADLGVENNKCNPKTGCICR